MKFTLNYEFRKCLWKERKPDTQCEYSYECIQQETNTIWKWNNVYVIKPINLKFNKIRDVIVEYWMETNELIWKTKGINHNNNKDISLFDIQRYTIGL